MVKDLSDFPIQYIKGVGPKRAGLLNRLGINNVRDALYYFPYRYENRTNIFKISELNYGQIQTVCGSVVFAEIIKPRGRKLKIFEMTVNDGSGLLKAKWFNQPFMKRNFKIGDEVLLYGVVKRNPYRGIGFQMDNPEYEIISTADTSEKGESRTLSPEETLIHMNRIVPVYRVTSGLSVRQVRTIMFNIITTHVDEVHDVIPSKILSKNTLPGITESLSQVHFPHDHEDIERLNRGASDFHKRLAFEELFMLELGLAVMHRNSHLEKGFVFNPEGRLLKRLLEILPFRLTNAQERVFEEILQLHLGVIL